MPEITAFAAAAADLIAWALLQPAAAGIVGGFFGGYTIGASKNKSALVEIVRGIVAGVAAGGVVLLIQMTVGGGGQ